METASDAEAKLRAEVELQNLYVQQAEKAADLAAKKAIAAEKAAEVARLQAEKAANEHADCRNGRGKG